jgi:hypothetical protein
MLCYLFTGLIDTLTPPSESYDREEVVVLIGQAPQETITHLLPIHRLGHGKFWNLGDVEPGLCNGVSEGWWSGFDLAEDGVHPGALCAG